MKRQGLLWALRLPCLVWLCIVAPAVARRGGGGGSVYETAYACEGSQLSFSCPDSQLIALIRANYGRFSISICNEHGTLDWSVDCKSNRSYNVIRESCGMKRKCSLPASTALFGDPCPGTFKYLEAHYQCIAESPTTTSSTTPFTTSTTSTTARPHIIIPATQYQRPPLPSVTTPQPSPVSLSPGVGSGDADRYRPLSTVAQTSSSSSPAPTSKRPLARLPSAGSENEDVHPEAAATTTLATTDRLKAHPKSYTPSGVESSSPSSAEDFGNWAGKMGPPSSTEKTSLYDVPHLARGRYQDPDRVVLETGFSVLHREYCPPMQSRSSFWNWTRAGDTAVQRCPNGAIGHARWNCLPGTPPFWEYEVPDLSACYSVWMENFKSRIDEGDSVVSVAVELEVITRTKSLLGGDILQAAGVLQRLLGRMTRKLEEIRDERQRYQVVKELLQSTVEVSSNLLEDYQRDSWLELPPRERRRVAGALLEVLDNSTWLLADTKNAAFRFSRAHGNVLVSVRLVETWAASEIRFPAHEDVHGTVWMRMQDSLVFPPQALLGSARNGVVKLVFLAYKNIEDFLGPEMSSSAEASSSDRIINSRVIAASVNSHHMLKLHQPVLITFQHREVENVTNPRCVFWSFDVGDWMTEGCWLKETNESHTVCACNHLTNFALSMDRRPSKLSASEQKLQFFVYASFAVCMVLLIATVLTLQVFRSLKGERVTIHKNLCLCLLVTETLLASGLGGHSHRVICGVLAGFLHYFWLASFFWVLLDGFQLYTVLLDVLGTEPPSSRLRWYYLLAYAAPAVIVCVSAGISPLSYGVSAFASGPGRGTCWIDMEGYQLWSFVGPASFCVLLCLVFLALVFCKSHRRVDPHATLKSKEQERIAGTRSFSVDTCLVLVALCLASAFAQMHASRVSLVQTCVFSVLNILLGIAVLFFCCLRNEKVRRALGRRLPCGFPGSRLGSSGSAGAQGAEPSSGVPQSGLFVHANGLVMPYSSTQQSWSSQKEQESSEGQDNRNCATQGLPSIATVTNSYQGEEHPLRSWICNAWPPQPPPPDCLPYLQGQWPPPATQYPARSESSWKPHLDPYSRTDHVYETIDEEAAPESWRSQSLRPRQGPRQNSYRSLGRTSVLANAVNDRTILDSLTAVLTSSPRSRHLPIVGDSCMRQQVAYSGIKSPSDSERSSSSLMEEERTESLSALEDRCRGRDVWSGSCQRSDMFLPEGVEHF